MRNFIFSVLLALSLSSTAFAGSSMTVCQAYVSCPVYCMGPYGAYACGSYPISCTTWADSNRGAACSWEAYPGVGVRCTGLTAEGLWDVVQASCGN